MTTDTAGTIPATTNAYETLVHLLSVFSGATAGMDELQNALQLSFLDLVDALRNDYAELQGALAESEAAILDLATLNPQWFAKVKTLKTPYGTVASRSTTKLVVKNEEVSLALAAQIHGPVEENPFLRAKVELNLEALENLDDAQLRALRIRRETTESCTVKPAKIDLGKAVKAAAEESTKS